MARLLEGIPEEFQNLQDTGNESDWKDWFAAEQKAFEAVQNRAIHIFEHPVADSSAYYEVVSLKPLTLRFIPYMDKWNAPDYVIRGLRAEDIQAQMDWKQRFEQAVANSRRGK